MNTSIVDLDIIIRSAPQLAPAATSLSEVLGIDLEQVPGRELMKAYRDGVVFSLYPSSFADDGTILFSKYPLVLSIHSRDELQQMSLARATFDRLKKSFRYDALLVEGLGLVLDEAHADSTHRAA